MITHAHADHARAGYAHYLAAASGAGILKARLGAIHLYSINYGEGIERNGLTLSLNLARHVLRSA